MALLLQEDHQQAPAQVGEEGHELAQEKAAAIPLPADNSRIRRIMRRSTVMGPISETGSKWKISRMPPQL
jgi:hypothetical protein